MPWSCENSQDASVGLSHRPAPPRRPGRGKFGAAISWSCSFLRPSWASEARKWRSCPRSTGQLKPCRRRPASGWGPGKGRMALPTASVGGRAHLPHGRVQSAPDGAQRPAGRVPRGLLQAGIPAEALSTDIVGAHEGPQAGCQCEAHGGQPGRCHRCLNCCPRRSEREDGAGVRGPPSGS